MYVVSCLPWIIYILTMDHHFPLPMWSVCCPHGPSVLSEMGQSVIVKRDLDPGTHSWPQLASPAFRYRPTHSCAEGGGCSVHQGNQSSRRITLSCRWRSANPEGGAVWQGLSVCELGGGLVFNRYMALFCREAVSVACSPSGLSLIIVFCHLSWRNQFNSFIQFFKNLHSYMGPKICSQYWHYHIWNDTYHNRVSLFSPYRRMCFHHICPDCIYSSLSESVPRSSLPRTDGTSPVSHSFLKKKHIIKAIPRKK